MHQAVIDDPSLAGDLREACAQDILFYVNGFGWAHNPAYKKYYGLPYTKVPFVTYPFQDHCLMEFCEAIDTGEDVVIEKSRDMGLSWMLLITFAWFWHFKPMQSFLLISSKKELVDEKGNPDTLFWKLRYWIRNMPVWMRPKVDDKLYHMLNMDTGSVINGTATTQDSGRGGRRTAMGFDEFATHERGEAVMAATGAVTDCRLFNSTPKGAGNAYYTIAHDPNRFKIRCHWKEHPLKSAGMYTSKNGRLEKLDHGYDYPDDYEFLLDNKLRSPWYDKECERAFSQREIAQELDINYLGADDQFFNSDALDVAVETFCKLPIAKGELRYDADVGQPIDFDEDERGCLRLWRFPAKNAKNRYVIGIDVSSGSGASNSVLSVWTKDTKEKVAEYASPHMGPESLAAYAVALARWYGDAQLIWEKHGPGPAFGRQVTTILRYRKVYWLRNEENLRAKAQSIPGWASGTENKKVLLGAYRKGIEDREVCNRSFEAMEECRFYIWTQNQRVEHSRSLDADDPSGAKDNHGDRVIADALAWKLVYERPRRGEGQEDGKPTYGSAEWARRHHEKEAEKARRW